MKIIFMGTPHFACPTLEKLINDNNFEIVAVYTREPQIAGRGHKLTNSPIHDLALKHNLKVITPKTLKTLEVQKEFIDLNADAAVVVAYGLILPEAILQGTKFGCINIHPSLLPRWRGAAPIQRTIMAGDKESGITIIKMDKGVDSGDMIYQEKITLDEKINYKNLAEKFSQMGADILVKTLKNIAIGNFSLTKQDDNLANYAKKIEKEECLIDWNNTAEEIDQKIRGLNGSLEAHFMHNDEKIKIFATEISHNFSTENIGKIIDKDLWIGCKNGMIRPMILQRPGKKPIAIEEFLLGFKF
ncbi:MAG: methionyl-tRNA formyltransferase [Rickettsiales bacterium]|nr:methionyl-tRNA formyltransferase [Rickettsiales bacterium]